MNLPLRNRFAPVSVAAFLAFSFVTSVPTTVKTVTAAEAPHPHVVVFLADDLGWGDVGWHDSEIKTPHLDRLASAGARLEQFYVQPVCSPTRAAFMTGRYPIRHGLQVGVVRPWAQYGLPLEERTLPQALREVGYETAICGKWHLGHFRSEYLPTRRGFIHQYGHYNGALDYFTHERDGGFDWHRDDQVCRDEGYSTHLLAKEACRLIDAHDASKPMFLYVPFNAVHAPHQVPERYKAGYEKLSEPRRTYAGMLTAMDEAVGQITSAVETKGMRGNTLFVFSSDNGGPAPGKVTSNGPLRAGKGTVYEGGVRVAAFATWDKKIPAGSQIQAPMHMVDWYPTLLSLAGASLTQPLPLDGKNAWDAITGKGASPHEEILLNVTPTNGAIRVGDWKLVVNGGAADDADGVAPAAGKKKKGKSNDTVELFNLANDLSETRNLSVMNPDKVADLQKRLDVYRKQALPPKVQPKAKNFVSPKVWGETSREVSRAENKRPNIIFVLADDLGYGDVKCLNPQGKIATPRLDALAASGMIFTDAHSGSAVCTPTRYGIMTGRYCWRSQLQRGVLGGLSPRLIEPNRMTVASFLQQHGYHTACVGKWHLGMDWVKLEGKSVTDLDIEKPEQVKNVDYSKPIANGPNSVGFDYYFGISASLDMVPYTYIENDRVAELPTVDRDFPLMLGKEQGRTRLGPGTKDFEAADVLPRLTNKAIEYVRNQADDAKQGKPFFLYLPLASPHTPIAPNQEWQGRSGLNPYADFVMETDYSIGKLIDEVDRLGLTNDTLIIVTSDNGCSPQADFPNLLSKGHNPSYVFRGTKADIFDGGHRVPMIARWPGRIAPGSSSGQLVCLLDFMATCSDILGEKLPQNAAEDSFSYLPAMEQRASDTRRQSVVHHSINGSFSIRDGNWKLEFCAGSGGWSAPRPGAAEARELPPRQLYNLESDVSESKNVCEENPEVVTRLTDLMEKYVADGRSTPGPKQANAVAIDIHYGEKVGQAAKANNQGKAKKAKASNGSGGATQ